MTPPIDDEEELEARRKKGDSGEGDQDSFGRGKAGAGAGMGAARLSSEKDKAVKSEHRRLIGSELIDAIVEFFSELPMRASANCEVVFEKAKTVASNVNVKAFAIVTWMIDFGTNAFRDYERNRDRTRGAARDSRGVQRVKPRTGPGMGMTLGPSGPTK